MTVYEIVPQEAVQASSQATTAESAQLLWLAEGEQLLGTAYLQLALATIARARELNLESAVIQQPSLPTDPCGAVTAENIAYSAPILSGEPFSWGSTSGPFDQVATAVLNDSADPQDVGDAHEQAALPPSDEEDIIRKLEVGGCDLQLSIGIETLECIRGASGTYPAIHLSRTRTGVKMEELVIHVVEQKEEDTHRICL